MNQISSVPWSAETRSETLLRWVRRQTRETAIGVAEYTDRIVELLLEMPEPMRGRDFNWWGKTQYERQKQNVQKIGRWMRDDVSARPSMDVENIMVRALLPAYRSACERDLANHRGGMFVPYRRGEAALLGLADLLNKQGDALKALAPVLADHCINAADGEPALRRAAEGIVDVQAILCGLQDHIELALQQLAAAGRV